MSQALASATVIAPSGAPLLRLDPHRFGPVAWGRVRRLLFALLVTEVAGAVVVSSAHATWLRAAGLSLVAPGGGFLYEGRPIVFALWIGVMAIAVVLWWGICAWWGVPLAWAVSALAAGLLVRGWRLFGRASTHWDWAVPAVYAVVVAAVVVTLVRAELQFRAKRARIPAINEYLAAATLPIPSKPVPSPLPVDHDLLRWAMSMALQPVERFRGFDWGEQFHGPTCLRYQLNFLGWALSLHAVNAVPNAPGSSEAALRSLIEKQTDLRVWRYWRTLNTIGNFDVNPDPIIRDNIMFNAYLADQINIYEAATGSDHFDTPGSLTFVWRDGRRFEYDHHSIAEAVARNFEANALGLYPCEPGWVFTWCNVMGAQALRGHDTLHGTGLWPRVEPRWRRGMTEEMLRPDGHFPHIRSKLVGLSFDTGEIPNNEYYLAGTNRLADVAPDLAVRGALLSFRGMDAQVEALRAKIHDGVLDHRIEARKERNTLIKTAVLDWTGVFGLARALGAEDVAEAALRQMEAACATGKGWPERPLAGGAQTVAVHLMTRWGSPLDTSELAARGYRAPEGPVLTGTTWPELLVELARSPDGEQLDLRRLTPTTVGARRFHVCPPRRRTSVPAAWAGRSEGADERGGRRNGGGQAGRGARTGHAARPLRADAEPDRRPRMSRAGPVLLNIDHTWTWLVKLRSWVLRRPQVTTDPAPMPTTIRSKKA